MLLFNLFSILPMVSPAYTEDSPVGDSWTAAARRPPNAPGGSVFTDATIQANGGRFWLGKSASAYCPPDIAELNCAEYPGGQTVFMGGNDTLFLDVGVPGGQQGEYRDLKEDSILRNDTA